MRHSAAKLEDSDAGHTARAGCSQSKLGPEASGSITVRFPFMEAIQITDKRDYGASKNGGAHPKLEASVAPYAPSEAASSDPKLEASVALYAPSEAASSVCAVRQNGEAFILNFRHPPTRHDFIQEKVEPLCGRIDLPGSATQQFSGFRRLSVCGVLGIPQRLQRSALWHRSLFSACQAESAG